MPTIDEYTVAAVGAGREGEKRLYAPVTPIHRVDLRVGGTITFGCEHVNVFMLDDAERALLSEIAAALKKYERAIDALSKLGVANATRG